MNFEEKKRFDNLKFNSHYLINFTRKKKKTDEYFSFHYDAFINTIIIPININNEQSSNFSMGLELIPNYRKLTHSMILNLFQKILIHTLHSHSISNTNTEKEKARLIIHVYNPFINNKLDRTIFKNIQKKREIIN